MIDVNRNDKILSLVNKFKEEALIPMKEDIAEWFDMLLAPEKFAPEEILTILQTGIIACQVATRLCEIISNQLEPPKFTTRAKVGTFFARDNAANFLTWCKLIGVDGSVLFESDGMCSSDASQKTPRQVLLCFLDIARIFGKRKDYNGPLPDLVKFEHEIDASSTGSTSTVVTPSGRNSAPPTTAPLSSKTASTPTRPASAFQRRATATGGQIPRGVKSPRTPINGSRTPTSGKTPTRKTPQKPSLLDKSIQEVKESTPYSQDTVIERISEGKYKIDGKLVFIRMLKNKHVMVRVGGGWDTLANYLLKHDCQKMVKIPTPTSLPKKEGGYLFPVSPRYKSQSASPTTKSTKSPAIKK